MLFLIGCLGKEGASARFLLISGEYLEVFSKTLSRFKVLADYCRIPQHGPFCPLTWQTLPTCNEFLVLNAPLD